MTQLQYAGASHVKRRSDVRDILNRIPVATAHLEMISYLIDRKPEIAQLPAAQALDRVFVGDKRAIMTIHYRDRADSDATRDGSFCSTLWTLLACGGKHLGAIYLDMRLLPHLQSLHTFQHYHNTRKIAIILAVNSCVVNECRTAGTTITERLADYRGLITGVMLDATRGDGPCVDLEMQLREANAIRDAHPELSIGFAVDLGEGGTNLRKQLLVQPGFSWHAHGISGKNDASNDPIAEATMPLRMRKGA